MSYKTVLAIRILYLIVVVQSFIKFLFLVRIFERISFFISTLSKLLEDVYGLLIFICLYNVFFTILFVIMDADIGTEYDQLYKPFKYFTFAIRNGLKDY
jgi:hypothetical protein